MKSALEGGKPLLVNTAIYAVLIIYLEIILRISTTGHIEPKNLPFLFFVPAQALALAVFTGFFKKRIIINKILMVITMLVLVIYYGAQLVYYKVFSSLFSVSMIGMGGDAIGNFWWAMKDALVASIGKIILVLLPVIITSVLLFVIKQSCKGYGYLLHILMILVAVGLWFAATYGIKLCGTDRQSAYYAYHNSLSDTDTSSQRLGALTTSMVEGASFYFGIGGTNISENINTVDTSILSNDMFALSDNAVSDNSISDNEAVSDNEATLDSETVSENKPAEREEPRVIFVSEPQVLEGLDFDLLYSRTWDQTERKLCRYFGSKLPTGTNEYTGLFEGYNLIYICAESFDTYAIDENLTPTLYKMAHGGIILNNYYNSFKNTTTNGEFAFDTGLWPDVSRDASHGTGEGSFACSVSNYMPFGLGRLFTNAGYDCYAYHNYLGEYYKRNYSWENLGYSVNRTRFAGEGMYFRSAWPSSDLEMMEQSIKDYINKDQFHAYYMTFSGHGPYTQNNYIFRKNYDIVVEKLGDRAEELDDCAIGFYCGNYEFELAMEYLLDSLEEAGKLDNTVIVIAGDHSPYYLTDDALNMVAGHEVDMDFELYESTCIIYNAAMEPIESNTYCCTVDILPTVLNLFNIPYDSRILSGVDIFSDGIHVARLYNGSFITDILKYNASTGKTTWFVDKSRYSDEICDSYLNTMLEYTDAEYAAAISMMDSNFYFFIWKNLYMTYMDITKEQEREEFVIERAETELLEEEGLLDIENMDTDPNQVIQN